MDYENYLSNDTDYLLKYPLDTSVIDNYKDHSTLSLVNKSVEDIMKSDISNDLNIKITDETAKKSESVSKNIESMLLAQDSNIIKLQAKLYSMFSSSHNTGTNKTVLVLLELTNKDMLKFIKIFENYCYFIRLYEHQLYCSNNDKYIKFLIDTIVLDDLMNDNDKITNFKLFKDIVLNFNSNPKNIYMRLSWILYQKDLQTKKEIYEKWNNFLSIRNNLQQLSNIWDERIQREMLNIIIKKYNEKSDHLNSLADLFGYQKTVLKLFTKWSHKTELLENYNSFGEELVKERVFKTVLSKKLSEMNLSSEKALNFKMLQLKKKVLSKWLNKTTQLAEKNTTATNYFDYKTKVEHIDYMKKKLNFSINLSIISDDVIKKKYLKSITNVAIDRDLADKTYFKMLKQVYWKKLLFVSKVNKFQMEQNYLLKKFILKNWIQKNIKQSEMKDLADVAFDNRDSYDYNKLFLEKINKRLNKIADLNIILEDHSILLNKSLLVKCLKSWSTMSHNIKIKKLDFLQKQFLYEKHFLSTKQNFMSNFQKCLSKNQELIKRADTFYSNKVKQKIVNAVLRKIDNLKNQEFIATQYKEKRLAVDTLSNLMSKYSFTKDLNELSSVYTDRKLYKNVKKAINHWNLKLLKMKNMSTSLNMHLTRWKRAELRGIISLWQNQIYINQSYKNEINHSKDDKSSFADESYSSKIRGFDDTDEDIIYETPAKKVQNRREVIDYSTFKNLEIQERKRFYQSSMKKLKANSSDKTILKPSPIKTSKTLSKTMKKKLEFEDSSITSDTYASETRDLTAKTKSRNDILNKYKLTEYDLMSNKSPFSSKKSDKNILFIKEPKLSNNDNDNYNNTIITSSPIKRQRAHLGNIPDLSKLNEL